VLVMFILSARNHLFPESPKLSFLQSNANLSHVKLGHNQLTVKYLG
jgi:hypothetical protein